MSPLIPTPDTLPVAWGWFQFLLLLTLPFHLLAMNAMVGSAGLALYARFRPDEPSRQLAHELAKVLPFLVAFTVNFGVAPLLFNQVLYGHFLYVSSILMAVFWLAVIPLLILAYYALYLYDFRFNALGKAGTIFLAMSLLIFFVIAFIYTNNMTLMLLPSEWVAYFQNDGGTLLNLNDPTLLPRYLHFMIGALAVGGLFVALFGKWREKGDAAMAATAVRLGMTTFTWLTLVQILVGLWFLMALPKKVMLIFMGGDMLATVIFLVALILALAVLVTGLKKKVYLTASLAVTLVVLMSFMRAYVRMGFHEPYFSVRSLLVVPQYSPMWVFFLSLVAGLLCIGWMIKKVVEIR
ncbi:hypothetical protein MJO47_12595 [Desulfuromonas sp. KJ2020]|uniref:hypothetical protein n=1 Tax=Desulfuromonas sp. KJ2020 TaxID=2919173 RepID=UPI0020A7CC05|nr:hypothetical protein [Desulfuromonas sp. KJ2020]MCP3177941.1 hypothetical protein [Desulfuromonas sp. KJ2020]